MMRVYTEYVTFIPKGFRRLNPREILRDGDLYTSGDYWRKTASPGTHVRDGAEGPYIRKIKEKAGKK